MSEQAFTPKRILVVVAHPDDAEFVCSGTLSRWYREGHELHFCLCTDGNHGSSDPNMTSERLAEIRQAEQRAAAAHVGADVSFLSFEDAALEPTQAVRKAITRVIRRFKPDIVVCQDPSFRYSNDYLNHPDHVAAGNATFAAIMPAASTRLIFPELLEEGLEPHNVRQVYLMGGAQVDTWIGLTEEDFQLKLKALREHKCQLGDWEPEPMMREWAVATAKGAKEAGVDCELAESFKLVTLVRD